MTALVIGADQLAVLDNDVLGKPGDHARAVEQLLAASGKTVTFLTAVCILDPVGRARYEHTDKTIVRFRQFDRRLAEAYLRHDEPYDCAGSFKLEGAGFVLFEAVRTDDPTALIGLPDDLGRRSTATARVSIALSVALLLPPVLFFSRCAQSRQRSGIAQGHQPAVP